MTGELKQASDLLGALTRQRYSRGEQIGDGTLGLVYRGREQESGAPVAVKVLLTGDLKAILNRLGQLVDATSSINYPALVRPLDFGQWEKRAFVVMPLADGKSADEMVSTGALAPGIVRDAAIDVACALETAHAHNLYHHDLKPSNLMLSTASGRTRARLLGLGLFNAVAGDDHETRSNLTTPQFQAPDQLTDAEGPPDARTDVYLLGAVMMRLLTGRGAASHKVDLLVQLIHGPDRAELARKAPGASASLREVILRAMQAKRSARFQSMTEMRRALEETEQQ